MSESNDWLFVDNTDDKRFELHVDGQIARVEYIPAVGKIVLSHTEVPQELEGRGLAKYLVGKVLDHLATQDVEVIPLCPYVISFIRKNPEYRRIVQPGYPV